MRSIKDIKAYWEDNTPQYWYSENELGTKEYYDDIQKHRYTVAYPYLPEYAEFGYQRGKRILEIGCGQGTDLLQYAKSGADAYGVDLTESAIKKTADIFQICGYSAELAVVNAEELNIFQDDFFDLIYSFGVIHHTPYTERVVDEIYRVSKSGGQVFIMIYAKGLNFLIKLFVFHVLLGGFLKQDFQTTINKNTEYKRNSPLTKMYSKKEARQLFHRFQDVSITKLHNPQLAKMLPKFIKYPIDRILGDNLFIKCRKA